MSPLYRILLVEDESNDAELNMIEISKVLPNCTFKIADNEPDFLNLIKTFNPDIIISDYNLPYFDGLSALKLSQDICPETPFIMVTGPINEDTAVECMKSGASDYVLKNSLKRLGAAVVNVLQQSKIKKERQEAIEIIKQNEANYRYLFANNPQPMWIYDAETLKFIEVNESAVNHYGYSQKEFLSMSLGDIFPTGTADQQLKWRKSAGNNISIPHEYDHVKKNGEAITVNVLSHSIIFNQRKAVHDLIEDITIRKKTEEALRISEERFRTLLDNVTNIAVQGYNADGTIKYWNNASEILYQYTKEEALGENIFDLIFPDNDIKEIAKIETKEMLNRGLGKPSEELEVIRKDGTKLSVYCNYSVTHVPGKEKEFFCIDVDLSPIKHAEEKLIQERKLLRTLIDNLPVTIYVKDIECRKIIANRADLEIAGFKSELDVIGKSDLECFEGELGWRGYNDDIKVITTGQSVLNREEDFVDIYGRLRWINTTKIPFTDDAGDIIGLVGIGRDITDQKIAQEKILKLSKGIEQSPVSIEITNTNGIVEYVNPHFCEMTGYTEDDVIGQYAKILNSDSMPENIYATLWDTIGAGGIWRNEILSKRKDGSTFWESASITSIKNDNGLIVNYIILRENLTERKIMEAELIEAKEKAEESDRLKSAFLANMSHEIRTPLNSIIGFSELLGDPGFDQEQKDEFIRTIVDNGNSLLTIISDIMDFSMLEARQMKIQKKQFSAKKLIADMKNDFIKKANIKGIELRIDETDELPDVEVNSDLYRIKQILANLVSNSLKFTEEGYVKIGYQIKRKDIVFHVKDTGIGIDKSNFQSIFDRFRQIDLAKTRKYGGNGLGLSISKNLVEILGGKIWVESEVDKYSNFFFTIPIAEE